MLLIIITLVLTRLKGWTNNVASSSVFCQSTDSFGSCRVQGRDNLIPLNGTIGGSFFSPRYPNDVPKSMSCIWHITTAKGSHINLNFRDFWLDYSCKNVHLEIRTGSPQDSSSKLIGRYCGYKNVPSIFSPGNSLWVHLKSNDQFSFTRGFTATYTAVSACEYWIQQ